MSNKRPELTHRTGGEKGRKSSQKTSPDHRKLPPFSDKHADDRRFPEYTEHDYRDRPWGESSDGRRKSLEFVVEPNNKQPEIWEINSSRNNKMKGGEGPVLCMVAGSYHGGGNRFMSGSRGEEVQGVFESRTRVGRESDAPVRQSEDEPDEEETDEPYEEEAEELDEEEIDEPYEEEADELDEEEIPTPQQASRPTLRDSLYENYKAMNNKDKWVLSTGRPVEDVLMKACKKMKPKALALSPARLFIVDTSDPDVEGWFSNEEWKEIRSELSPLPEADKTLVDSLKPFHSVGTTAELREKLKSGLIPGDVSYNRNVHFNLQWAEMVLLKFLILLEAPNEPLIQPHNEGWYGFNIWSQILDTGLLDLQGLKLEREDTCKATAKRRNAQSDDPTGRAKTGNRLDGIICTLGHWSHEFGGVEDSARFEGGVAAKKWRDDQCKLIKCMRDMFKLLDDLVESDTTIKRRIQIVGISTGALALQYTLLGHPGKGHVCLLQKGKVVHVPTTVGEIGHLLRMLVMVAQLKQLIKVSFEAVKERDQELVGGNAGGRSGTKLQWSAPSP